MLTAMGEVVATKATCQYQNRGNVNKLHPLNCHLYSSGKAGATRCVVSASKSLAFVRLLNYHLWTTRKTNRTCSCVQAFSLVFMAQHLPT
jgi:hypothetical protein